MSCERQVPYAVMNYRELIKEDFGGADRFPGLAEAGDEPQGLPH